MTGVGEFLLGKMVEKLDPYEDYSVIHQLSCDTFAARYSSNGEPELDVREMTEEEIAFSQIPTFARI